MCILERERLDYVVSPCVFNYDTRSFYVTQAVLSEEPLPSASDLLTAASCSVASPAAAAAAAGSNVQTLSSRTRPLATTPNLTGGARGRGITAPPSLVFLAPNAPSLRTGLPFSLPGAAVTTAAAAAAVAAALSTASASVAVPSESDSQLQVTGGSNADAASHSHAMLTAAISSATAASVHSDSGTFFARRHYVTSRLYMRLNSLFADNQVGFGHNKILLMICCNKYVSNTVFRSRGLFN